MDTVGALLYNEKEQMFGMKRTNFLKDEDMRVVSIAGTAAEAEPLCCEWAEVCQKRKIQKRRKRQGETERKR